MTKPTGLYGGRDPADVPAYTLREAARLARVPKSTLRSWVLGRAYTRRDGPARSERIIIAPGHGEALTFTNVVEAHVLSALRNEYELELSKIRRAVRYVRTTLKIDHPLAREPFKTDGVDLFVERLGELLNVSRAGQKAMREVLEGHLERVEYGGGSAVRLFPLHRRDAPRTIVIDPRVAFGRPVIDGTAAPVEDIAARHQAGDGVADIAADFGVTTEQVEEALRAASVAA